MEDAADEIHPATILLQNIFEIKSSKVKLDRKTLISVFVYFFRPSPKNLFLQWGLGTGL